MSPACASPACVLGEPPRLLEPQSPRWEWGRLQSCLFGVTEQARCVSPVQGSARCPPACPPFPRLADSQSLGGLGRGKDPLYAAVRKTGPDPCVLTRGRFGTSSHVTEHIARGTQASPSVPCPGEADAQAVLSSRPEHGPWGLAWVPCLPVPRGPRARWFRETSASGEGGARRPQVWAVSAAAAAWGGGRCLRNSRAAPERPDPRELLARCCPGAWAALP